MKKSYHICISSDDEVMFRDNDDYNRGFNTLALALHKTDSTGLVESIMSTHIHMLIQTSNPDHFAEAYTPLHSRNNLPVHRHHEWVNI